MHTMGFTVLNVGICVSNLLYAPVIYFLRYFYEFKPLESNELNAISNNQSTIGGAGFKRFNNDESEFHQSNYNNNMNNTNQQEYQSDYQANNNGNNSFNYQQQTQPNRPESAQFQSMQKYPRKPTKNPYKDTHNLIDNMEDEDY